MSHYMNLDKLQHDLLKLNLTIEFLNIFKELYAMWVDAYCRVQSAEFLKPFVLEKFFTGCTFNWIPL